MLIEFGNHCELPGAVDGAPKVTRIHIPEADETGQGGYTHQPRAVTVPDFTMHCQGRVLNSRGLPIFHQPDSEILLAVTQEGWRHHAAPHMGVPFIGGEDPLAGVPDLRPAWVRVRSHEDVHGSVASLGQLEDGTRIQPHDKKVCKDIEKFLAAYYGGIPVGAPPNLEELYHTAHGPPGVGPGLPEITNGYPDDGRVQQANNQGGGQVGAVGTGTAASATTLTTASTYTTNQWTGYRVYVMQTGSGPIVWGNIVSNTNTVNASVLTVDRWYNAATPGGAAATTPSAGFQFIIADGGMVSGWFAALSTDASFAFAHGDHTITSEYTTAGGGMVRKISPYALTSGVSPMTYTLTPVFTANGSDTVPSSFYGIGFFCSMVPGFGGANGPMKFKTPLNATATVNTSGDQLTVTETVTGS